MFAESNFSRSILGNLLLKYGDLSNRSKKGWLLLLNGHTLMGKTYNEHSKQNSLYDHIARKKNLTKASKLDVEISTSPPIDKKVLMYFSFFVISFNDFFY